MKIAYVGNFSQSHCTEVHLAATLEDLGHEVIRLQENELQPGWVDVLLREWDGLALFLFTRTWGNRVKLSDIERLRELHIPTVSYHLDLYVGLSRKYLHEGKTLDEVLQTDPFWRTDFVFTPDGDPKSAEVFKANGVNHYYMKAGVFEEECKLYEPATVGALGFYKLHDVLFVGGGARPGDPNAYGHPEWNYRNELIAWLMDTYGERFTKFGHPQETIRNEELNRLYSNTKVVVGDSVCLAGFTHENYWSDRVYETIGRGGFLIHPYIKGMEEEFTDGETIVFYEYGNWDQLKEKIDYYLEHDDEREKIRRAGHEFVKKNCTYTQRMIKMLNTVFPDNPTNPYVGKGIVYFDEASEVTNEALDTINGSTAVPTPTVEPSSPIKINLGAGREPTEGWVNVDWIAGPGIDKVHNLLDFPWPFEDQSADEILARDVLEHMPNYTPDNKATVMAFVEECHRILVPGGILTIQVPHWASPNMWIDPTHVRGFDPKSMDYFDPDTDFGKWYGYYSDKKFKVEAMQTYMGDDEPKKHPSNIIFTMVKR